MRLPKILAAVAVLSGQSSAQPPAGLTYWGFIVKEAKNQIFPGSPPCRLSSRREGGVRGGFFTATFEICQNTRPHGTVFESLARTIPDCSDMASK